LSADVIDVLVTRADGVPLFAEELTHAVVEAGADAAAAIPVTLQDSLLARLDRLSSAKEVAQRAAVLGREFSYALLAATAELDETALRQGLARLVDAELLFVRGVPPEATYTFKHALVQEAAYESILKRTRQQLHGRVVDVLLTEFPERAAAAPEVVGRHAEVAGRMDEAIAYHQRAGEQAQARSAHTEAIGHLRHAIDLLAAPALSPVEGRPENPGRDVREAALQLTLAASVRPARGVAHPECETAYERARVLSEAAGDVRLLGLALTGLSSFCSNAGNAERGAALASRVLAIAEQNGDQELALLGNAELGIAEFWQGKFASALARYDAARSLSEAERRRALDVAPARNPGVMPFSYLDQGVSALTLGSWSIWFLGWPDRAVAGIRNGVALARELRDPFNQAFALTVESVVHLLRRDVAAQRERAEEAIAVSEAHGFPMFLGVARVCQGAARVAAGETAAIADMVAGLSVAAETGFQAGAPFLLSWLAEAYMIAGQLAEADGAVDLALAVAAETGQHGVDAELQGLQGEIALGRIDATDSRPQAEAKAEECFHRALDIARGQDARSYELRAVTRLARLWRDQGKRAEARDLLAPVYAWFTEGFDSQDLKDAKALLEELGA
jgi:tetratricopeptide (TPR) repeat protein